jgi:hypothetical protein
MDSPDAERDRTRGYSLYATGERRIAGHLPQYAVTRAGHALHAVAVHGITADAEAAGGVVVAANTTAAGCVCYTDDAGLAAGRRTAINHHKSGVRGHRCGYLRCSGAGVVDIETDVLDVVRFRL